MTTLTPQQMRELANEHLRTSAAIDPGMVTALRAAADQLEAVQDVLDLAEADNAPHLYPDDFTAILTAGTAPQDGRDE